MSIALTLTQAATDVVALLPLQIPDPDPVQPPGTEGFTSIIGWAKWVALAVSVLGLFAAGALMAIQSRRVEGGEHVGKIGMALSGVIVISVISAAGSVVGFLMS